MNKGVALTFLEKLGNSVSNIYHQSYFAHFIMRIGKFFNKSLNGSMIISRLLRYNKDFGRDSFIDKIIKLLYKGVLRIFNHIRNFLEKPFKSSFLYKIIMKESNIDINILLRVAFTGAGTCILTYTALSLVFSGLSNDKVFAGLLLSVIFYILGFTKLDLKTIFYNSYFIKIVRDFFDYNS